MKTLIFIKKNLLFTLEFRIFVYIQIYKEMEVNLKRKHYCETIVSKTGKEYKRSLEDVKCPRCNREYTRAYKSNYTSKVCKICSQLENNHKKAFNGCATIGELTGSFYNATKQRAKYRNIEFNVSKEFLWNLFLEQNKKCALSGIPLKLLTFNKWSDTGKSRHYDTSMINASLDRIDSDKGYTEDNVQWIHKVVNIMKNTLAENDFIYFCKKVSNNNIEKGNLEPTFINGSCKNIIMKKVQRLTVEDNHSNNTDTRIPHPAMDEDIV